MRTCKESTSRDRTVVGVFGKISNRLRKEKVKDYATLLGQRLVVGKVKKIYDSIAWGL